MIIGTAGHIDHGKTSLVRALTQWAVSQGGQTSPAATDRTDRLQEEKARGITVDLGFAYAPTGLAGGPSSHPEVFGFVDVPGHEKLVRNMLAGAAGVDHVMLVVAADDGPMPQTLEHVAILNLLGVQNGVVALTKVDLVSTDHMKATSERVRQMMAATDLAHWPIVPVSTRTGEGVAAVWQTLLDQTLAHPQPGQPSNAGFRLAVDRCFSLPGIGTVVTGTASSGQVVVGDRLWITPKGVEVRVRGIHAQNQKADRGHQGQRLALNLAGVEKADVRRGDWVTLPALHAPTQRLEARLFWLPSEPKAVMHGSTWHLHLGTASVMARVGLLESESIQPGANALVQLELDRPLGALRGDRFVLRDPSATRTVGGGMVLEAWAPSARRVRPQRVAQLRALENASPAQALQALLALRPADGVDASTYSALWNLDDKQTEALLQSVAHRALTEDRRQWLFAPGQLEAHEAAIVSTLQAHHARAPDSPGMTQEALKRSVRNKPTTRVFALLLRHLLQSHALERDGASMRLKGHEATLQGAEKQLWERLKPWLDEGGMHAPKLSDMLLRDRTLRKDQMMRVLQRLERMGKVHAVGAEYFIQTQHVLAWALACEQVVQHDEHQRLNVKALREATGLTRHLSVPLVEFFDRIGFTQRDAMGRHIRRDAKKMFGGEL